MAQWKNAEAVALSEKHFSDTMIQSMPGVIYFYNEKRQFLRWNRNMEEVSGYSGKEIAQMHPLDFFPEKEKRSLEEKIAEVFDKGAACVEAAFLAKNGTTFPYFFTGNRVMHNGEACLIGMGIDVAERKQAEARIAESERKYRELVELANSIILRWNCDGQVTFLNEFGQRFFGYSAKEIMGRHVIGTIVPPVESSGRDLQRLMEEICADPAAFEQNVNENMCRDGKRVFIAWTNKIVSDANGKIIEILSIGTDITARKAVEDELRWKTAFLEAQVDSSLDGILVVDSRGKRILQNRKLIELWKVPSHLAEGKNDTDQLQFAAKQTKNPEEFIKKVTYLNEHPDEIGLDEIELVNGTILERYSYPVRDKVGKHYGRIWTFRDITERRKLETRLRQAQKMEAIGQLASGVAHDFNNILAVILIQAGLIKVEEELSEKLQEFAVEIEKAAQRAGNLTRQLLLFSRQQPMRMHDLDLNETVTHMTKMLHRILGENIQMQFKLSPVPLVVQADAGMIDQILLNLTVNARDAMPAGGKLLIETSIVEFDETTAAQAAQARPGTFACLSVSDTGCGIAPENLPRIFEPFFTTKDVGKGTGLGLATVFGIAQQHQGWINAYSEVDQGTAFRVYLPLVARPADPRISQPSLTPAHGGHETILLVEDDLFLRSSVKHALSSLGYSVLEAATGSDALYLWQQHRRDIRLLLTDLMLPGGMTGREIAEQLTQADSNLRVIYSSGYSSEIATKHLVLEEGVDFLPKPFEASKLAQIVRNCLDKV